MMRVLKEKFHRGQKDGINDARQDLRVASSVKQRRNSASRIDVNPTSCLKNSDHDTYSFILDARNYKSELKGFSKGSLSVDSSTGRTSTTCGCSSRSKKCRFAVVEIRQYERIASDNPSCSSGPPIGIGWNHGEAHMTSIDDYEQSRGDRRFNLDFVLSRKERETLLLKWNVDAKAIAASTRAANKTKLQRKQTVVNARKYSKLEEYLETSSRRLKRALLPRRRIDYVKDGALESTTPHTFATDHSSVENALSTSPEYENNKLQIHITEPDDDVIEKLMNNMFDIPKAGKGCGGDDNISVYDDFTLGATTIEDSKSCTPSVYEIEKFHKNLELELFGEETELPSMVGQTLEVPVHAENRTNLNTIDGRRSSVQDDIPIEGGSHLNQRPYHLERYPFESFSDGPQRGCSSYDAMRNTQDSTTSSVPATSVRPRSYHHHSNENFHHRIPLNHDASLPLQADLEHSNENGTAFRWEYTNSLDPFSRNPGTELCHSTFSPHGEFDSQYTQYPRGSNAWTRSERNSYRYRRSGSFDSSYNTASRQHEFRYSRPESQIQQHTQPVFEPSNLSMPSAGYSEDIPFEHINPGGRRYDRGSFYPSSRDVDLDGPQVHHVPLFGHISVNQLMDGSDGEHCFYNDSTVTITEANS